MLHVPLSFSIWHDIYAYLKFCREKFDRLIFMLVSLPTKSMFNVLAEDGRIGRIVYT
jgi:hypothetical protein